LGGRGLGITARYTKIDFGLKKIFVRKFCPQKYFIKIIPYFPFYFSRYFKIQRKFLIFSLFI